MNFPIRKMIPLSIGTVAISLPFYIILTLQGMTDRNARSYECPTLVISNPPFVDSTERERFKDEKVDKLIQLIKNQSLFDVNSLADADFSNLAKSLGRETRNNASYARKSLIHNVNKTVTSNHLLFHYGIQMYSLYNPDDPAIPGLLNDMSNQKIIAADVYKGGSEFKLLIRFATNAFALLKPMRNKREYETPLDQYQFEDFERHNAEIAAFHLSRTLGFYNVPPVSGRRVHLTREIRPLAHHEFNGTFYYSPVGNLCFWGVCSEYCDPRHSFCGKGDTIEVSLMAFLPSKSFMGRGHPENPYRSAYTRHGPAHYAQNENYCDKVFRQEPIATMDALLNVIDLHIFDFLQGNRDRHTLNHFIEAGIGGFLNVIDNGRAFGKTKTDEHGILAPLWQCCKIRESTLKKFLSLYLGPRPLSYYFDQSMRSDPLYPILVDGHLTAVDRRATHVLRTVMDCIEKGNRLQDVVIKHPI